MPVTGCICFPFVSIGVFVLATFVKTYVAKAVFVSVDVLCFATLYIMVASRFVPVMSSII